MRATALRETVLTEVKLMTIFIVVRNDLDTITRYDNVVNIDVDDSTVTLTIKKEMGGYRIEHIHGVVGLESN